MASVDVVLEGPITDPALFEKLTARFMVLMADLLETQALPRMLQGIPVRTGNLRRALRFTYITSGQTISVGFTGAGYYWRYLPKMRAYLETVFFSTVYKNAQPVFNQAVRDVLGG